MFVSPNQTSSTTFCCQWLIRKRVAIVSSPPFPQPAQISLPVWLCLLQIVRQFYWIALWLNGNHNSASPPKHRYFPSVISVIDLQIRALWVHLSRRPRPPLSAPLTPSLRPWPPLWRRGYQGVKHRLEQQHLLWILIRAMLMSRKSATRSFFVALNLHVVAFLSIRQRIDSGHPSGSHWVWKWSNSGAL